MTAMLISAGVADTGEALIAATVCGQEPLREVSVAAAQEWKARGEEAEYLDTPNSFGATPLVRSIPACRSCSPRITRLLVDAGADTAAAVRISDKRRVVFFDDTPLVLANWFLRDKKVDGKDATEDKLHSLEAVRRLLTRVKAVHAFSWLWVSDFPSVIHAAAEGTTRVTKATPTPLISMLPVLRRRAGRPRVLLAALFRNPNKPLSGSVHRM